MRTYKLMRHLAVDPPARALRSGCECFSVCFGTCNELDMESVTPSCVYVSCLLGLKCLIYWLLMWLLQYHCSMYVCAWIHALYCLKSVCVVAGYKIKNGKKCGPPSNRQLPKQDMYWYIRIPWKSSATRTFYQRSAWKIGRTLERSANSFGIATLRWQHCHKKNTAQIFLLVQPRKRKGIKILYAWAVD